MLYHRKNIRTKNSLTTTNMAKHSRVKTMKKQQQQQKQKKQKRKNQLRRKQNIWKLSGTNQNQPDLQDIKEFLLIFNAHNSCCGYVLKKKPF